MSTKNFSLILKLSTQTRFEYSNTFGDTNKYFLIKNLTKYELDKLKKSSSSSFGYAIVDNDSGFTSYSSKQLMSLFFPRYLENYPDSTIVNEGSEDPIIILHQKISEGNVKVIQKLDPSIPQKTITVA